MFAVQTCLEVAAYDPLDVGQWEFYVVAAPVIAGFGYRSANLACQIHFGMAATISVVK